MGQLLRIFHPRNVLNVTLDDDAQVLAVPLSGAPGRPTEGFRIAARHQPLGQSRFGRNGSAFDVGRQSPFQQSAQEPAGLALLLRFREGL